jgi:hypothetical protein
MALVVTDIVIGPVHGAGMPPGDPARAASRVDPNVRALVGSGRVRVLVLLRVPEESDEARRAAAIGRAQEALLSRLPEAHASVTRRYASVPMLGLEIDASALSAIETMPDIVASVTLDRPVMPQ